MAHNLSVTGIAHGYWTSRLGNGTRLGLWRKRRSHAAPFLRAIAPRHAESIRPALLRAAEAFERETGILQELTVTLPAGEEAPHWREDRIATARALLARAEAAHRLAMEALAEAVPGGLAAEVRATLASRDAEDLQRRVGHPHTLVAEAALTALVRLAPPDLDARLAALWDLPAESRKTGADGPIHRQILFALARLDTPVATDAIGRAVLFEGKGDDVPRAICRWAAEMTWKRRGVDARDLFVRAFESASPVVRAAAVPYLGRLGDRALLPRLQGVPGPEAALARALLGEAAAVKELFAALAGDQWYGAYTGLLELGAAVEAESRSRLEAGPSSSQALTLLGILISRVGGPDSLEALRKAAAAHPEIPRLAKAVKDLEERLSK